MASLPHMYTSIEPVILSRSWIEKYLYLISDQTLYTLSMYTIHQTKGVVLDGVNIAEASRYLHIFTRDFGLIGASAQGLRELKSKLRYSLQDFTYGHLELVRGKNGWRVTSAEAIEDLSSSHERSGFEVVARLCSLLRRLLTGEEKNDRLFDDIVAVFTVIKNSKLSKKQISNLEVVAVMRTLNHLGYWGDSRISPFFLEHDISDTNLLEKFDKTKSLAIREINKSLQETQL